MMWGLSGQAIRKKNLLLQHLARFARIASSLRFAFDIRVICVQSSLLPIFWKVGSQKKEARIDLQRIFAIRVQSIRVNRPTKFKNGGDFLGE